MSCAERKFAKHNSSTRPLNLSQLYTLLYQRLCIMAGYTIHNKIHSKADFNIHLNGKYIVRVTNETLFIQCCIIE